MKQMKKTRWSSLLVLCVFFLFACDDETNEENGMSGGAEGGTTAGVQGGTTAGAEGGMPAGSSNAQYFFESRFDQKETVSINGQALRLLLIHEISAYLDEISTKVDEAQAVPMAGEIKESLVFYYDFNEAGADVPHRLKLKETDPPILQQTFGEIAIKNLKDKIAGNDTTTQYKDWGVEGVLGWNQSISPEDLLFSLFDGIDSLLVKRAQGEIAKDPSGQDISGPLVSAEGLHYEEMIQKFLTGAVAFSQASDDYLDDALEGEGILVDNEVAEEGENWTALEHHWDEGFGYFGLPRAYQNVGYIDLNADGKIDLLTEYQAGLARYAKSRDEAGQSTFAKDIFDAFLAGRKLISANGNLDTAKLTELKGYRDTIVQTWEKVIAASAIHYVNDCLEILEASNVDFSDLAKDWSELKGLSLAFQFNPKSKLSAAQFTEMHEKIGLSAPIWDENGQWATLKANLIEVRQILSDVYGWTEAESLNW